MPSINTPCRVWCTGQHTPGLECTGRMIEIPATGDPAAMVVDDSGALLPLATVYLTELPDGRTVTKLAVTVPGGRAVEVALTEWDTGRLGAAFGDSLAALTADQDMRAVS
jgi:hypothetical protein